MDEGRNELLQRMGRVRNVSHLSYEDQEMLEEWLAEPHDDDHDQYMVNRSSLEVLERLQTDGPLGQIYLIQTLRTFISAQRDGQRLLEEAQAKLTQVRTIVGQHVNNPSGDDDRLETLSAAMEILKVLDRPDDPWDVSNVTDKEDEG